jgi:phenylacetate-CoA ligase
MTATERGLLWNPAIEMLSQDELHDLQLERLQRQLAYNYTHSPIYRAKFDAAGADPSEIHTLEDLARLPLLTKAEHREAQAVSLAEHGHPWALLGCAAPEEIVRISASSGVSGTPTLYGATARDVAVVNELLARKYWRAGIRPGSVMLQALSLSMFTGGLPLSQGIQHLGACVVPVGIAGGTRRVLEYIELTRPRALIATPSFGLYLIEQCPELTGKPATELGLRSFFCTGEPGGGDPATRTLLAEGLRARIFDHAGGGHAFHAISCNEPPGQYRGMHFVSPDHCIVELLDPLTRQPVALQNGAIGEMVWTFLDWQGGPFQRYAVGDVVEVHTHPCPCGQPGMRVRILGRTEDMLTVKGVNVYPEAIREVVASFHPQVTGLLRILLERPGPGVEPPLRIRLEYGMGVGDTDRQPLERALLARIRDKLQITPELEWVAPGTLPRETMKTQLVELHERATP